MKIANCVLLLAAAALYIQAVTNEADLADMSELDSQAGGPIDLAENPTKAECATVSRSLSAMCTVFGEKNCAAFRSKHNAKCGAFNMEDDNEEDNEDIGEDDDQDPQRPVAANDQHDEGSKRGGLMTTGSFVMRAATSGAMEEELGDDDEAEVEEWDLSNSGKCDEHEEAWVQTDASDKTMGKCIQYAADTKCGGQCFHQGKSVTEEEEQAICSKICRVPGHGGAKCNVIKTVEPMKEKSIHGKTMYHIRSKVTQADRNSKVDPMACAGIRPN